MGTRTIAMTLALLGATLGAAVPAGAQPLRRDLDSYVVLALKTVRLKNMTINGPCNVGVDCGAAGGGECGTIRTQALAFGTGTQLVGDQVFFTTRGASIFQLFRNGGGALDAVTIAAPPVQPFTPPIIPGTCDDTCTLDLTAIDQLCGFPDPFPACNAAQAISVQPGQDCPGDTNPGNGACDLPPGVYGNLSVHSHGTLNLAAGSYTFCSVSAVRSTAIHGSGATVLVPKGGNVHVSNDSTFGDACGDITLLVDGSGLVRFGHAVTIAARVCAPQGKIALGHGNHLLGQFVGNFISSDRGNDGMCCGGGTSTSTTISTTTSTSATSSSSTTISTSTSTSTPSSTSTSTTASSTSSTSFTTSTSSTSTSTSSTSSTSSTASTSSTSSTSSTTSTTSSTSSTSTSTSTSTSSSTSTTSTSTSTTESTSTTTTESSTSSTTPAESTTTTTEPAVAICGDGIVDPLEACDPPLSACHCPNDPPDPNQFTGTCADDCLSCLFCSS